MISTVGSLLLWVTYSALSVPMSSDLVGALLFQRAVEGREERSDLQPEVPVDLRELLFELLQVDLNRYHLLAWRCRLHRSPVVRGCSAIE